MWERMKKTLYIAGELLAQHAPALKALLGAAALACVGLLVLRTVVWLAWGRRGVVCLRRALLLLAVGGVLVLGAGGPLRQAARSVLAAPAAWVSGWLDGAGEESWLDAFRPEALDAAVVGTLEARHALLLNCTDGSILWEQSADEKTAPASTAKLLTALTVWQVCRPEEPVTAGAELGWVAQDASRAGLAAGDCLTVRELTAALLLPSGNDAAYVLAAHAGRALAGADCSTDRALTLFRTAMNETARTLGARSSRFVTPDGYDAQDQYTTARDMACIGWAFWQNAELAAIAGQTQADAAPAAGRALTWTNTHLLLQPGSDWYLPGVVWGKTGCTSTAGGCLVTAAEQDGTQYLCVVLGSTETGRWADTCALLRAAGV